MKVAAAVSAVALVAVVVIAIVDHTHKHSEKAAARKAAWFCVHKQTQCGGADPVAIEDAWNRRERVYVLLALGLAVSLGVTARAGSAGRRTT